MQFNTIFYDLESAFKYTLEDMIRVKFCMGAGTCKSCQVSGVDILGTDGRCFECHAESLEQRLTNG